MVPPSKYFLNIDHPNIVRNIVIVAICIFLSFPSFSVCSPSYDSTHQIFHFHGEDTSSNLGYFIKSLGDINDDDFDDIAISTLYPQGTYIFFGGYPIDSFPDYFLNYFGLFLILRIIPATVIPIS